MQKLKKEVQFVVDVYKSGDFVKAEQLAKSLIKNNPKVVFLYNLLGLILVEQNKIDEAIKCYEMGIKVDANFSMIYNNLGLLHFKYKTETDIKKIENFYKKAIELDKNLPEAENNLGSLYNHINKIDDAINCYKNAIKINPKFSFAHHNLGSAYVSIGKYDLAKNHFKESIKLNPNFLDTHRMLSRITKYTKENKHLNELKEIYKNIKTTDIKNKVEIGFSLGKAYEDIKDFKQSFEYYNEANTYQKKNIKFSINEESKKFEEIKNTYTTDIFKKYKGFGNLKASPIFILGMPRSCTTLVEQIISSHKKVFGADEVEFISMIMLKNFGSKSLRLFFNEIADFNASDLTKMGTEYLDEMKRISNNAERTTDKFPQNFLNIGYIKLILPRSKIIHCKRNAQDNCFSIFKNHFSSGKIKFGYNIDDIVNYYNLYSDLMDYWSKIIPEFIYTINYENLVTNTKNEIKNLLNFCELDWDDNCLDFHKNKRPIKTASDTQARYKIYDSSVDSWKKYENFFNKHFLNLKTN